MSAMPARERVENTEALVPLADQSTSAPLAPVPLYSARDMTAAVNAYKQLQQALDQAMPDQIINLDGKPFRKKGYWRAVAVAFGLEMEAVRETREIRGQFDDGRENFGYLVVYRASTKSGRSCTGDGTCFAIEKAKRSLANKWAELPRQASEHNVRAHAHTRAFNRAVSNLVGFGEVSAEEAMGDDESARVVAPPPAGYPEMIFRLRAAAGKGLATLLAQAATEPEGLKRHMASAEAGTWTSLKQQAQAVEGGADAGVGK